MKKSFLLTTALGLAALVGAQSLSPTVVSTSGAYYTAGGASVSQTVGEMTMVQTFTGGSNILTQGFQQSDKITAINEPLTENLSVQLYPNPAVDFINIGLNSTVNGRVVLGIYNELGQVVSNSIATEVKTGQNQFSVNTSKLATAVYYIQIDFYNSNGVKQTATKKFNVTR